MYAPGFAAISPWRPGVDHAHQPSQLPCSCQRGRVPCRGAAARGPALGRGAPRSWRRPRHQAGGDAAVEGHGVRLHVDRRPWAAAHRLAQPARRGRVGAQDLPGPGARQAPPRALGALRPGLEPGTLRGPRGQAAAVLPCRLPQGLDAQHGRAGLGRGGHGLVPLARGGPQGLGGQAQGQVRVLRAGAARAAPVPGGGQAPDRPGAGGPGLRVRSRAPGPQPAGHGRRSAGGGLGRGRPAARGAAAPALHVSARTEQQRHSGRQRRRG